MIAKQPKSVLATQNVQINDSQDSIFLFAGLEFLVRILRTIYPLSANNLFAGFEFLIRILRMFSSNVMFECF